MNLAYQINETNNWLTIIKRGKFRERSRVFHGLFQERDYPWIILFVFLLNLLSKCFVLSLLSTSQEAARFKWYRLLESQICLFFFVSFFKQRTSRTFNLSVDTTFTSSLPNPTHPSFLRLFVNSFCFWN